MVAGVVFSPLICALLITIALPISIFHIYYQTPRNIFQKRNFNKTPKHEKVVQKKLMITKSQNQLFFNHTKWIITELAKKTNDLDQLPTKNILTLIKETFEGEMIDNNTILIDKLSTDLKNSICQKLSEHCRSKSSSSSNIPRNNFVLTNNHQYSFSLLKERFKHSRSNSC